MLGFDQAKYTIQSFFFFFVFLYGSSFFLVESIAQQLDVEVLYYCVVQSVYVQKVGDKYNTHIPRNRAGKEYYELRGNNDNGNVLVCEIKIITLCNICRISGQDQCFMLVVAEYNVNCEMSKYCFLKKKKKKPFIFRYIIII